MVVRYIPPKLKKEQLREEEGKMSSRVKDLERKNFIYFPIDYKKNISKLMSQTEFRIKSSLLNPKKTRYEEEVIKTKPSRTDKIRIKWYFRSKDKLPFNTVMFNSRGAVLNPRRKKKALTSASLLCYLKRNPKIYTEPVQWLKAFPRLEIRKDWVETIKFHIDRLDSSNPAKIFSLTRKSYKGGPYKSTIMTPFTEKEYKDTNLYRISEIEYNKLVDMLVKKLRKITNLKPYDLYKLSKMNYRKRRRIWKVPLEKVFMKVSRESKTNLTGYAQNIR